jgi:redox-sensitive bicupin YhaK (pirin superfamily)
MKAIAPTPEQTSMIERRPYALLSGDERAWLKARHHISFVNRGADEPERWGTLCAWNDDEIAPDSGFPMHPHSNMEIITYVREGSLTHRDSLGNVGKIEAGDVQVMSAGTGIRHAEYNLQRTPLRLFQIWILPDRAGDAPAWGTKPFPKKGRTDRFVTLASGFPEDSDALPIRARARVLGATLRTGAVLRYSLLPERLSYLVVARGELVVNGILLHERDGAAIKGVSTIAVRATHEAEVVVVDVPPEAGAP